MTSDRWPALPLAAWRDTYATLHMWMQRVGKLTLTTTPLVNHWWNVAFHYAARGFTTLPMNVGGGRTFTAAFDFLSHELILQASDGSEERIRLAPKSVAQFHEELSEALERMEIAIPIWTTPVECEERIPFERDGKHCAYDAERVTAFWRALDTMRPAFEDFRAKFTGKCSPLHFFWGAPDLALTRFSGRTAPASPQADPVEREAYSHEVISHGFWAGGSGYEACFYAYARPEPEGFKSAKVRPAAALYDAAWAEFMLPYEAVRTAANPAETLTQFLESTYAAAADLARWDRGALERRA